MGRDLVSLGILLAVAACQPRAEQAAKAGAAEMPATAAAPAPGTPEAKILEAMSAAPATIAANATIMDWPATEGGEMVQLRAGTNGWVCLPSSPAAIGVKDPTCVDDAMMALFDGWVKRTSPEIPRVGFAYMLQGDAGASATDPFATSETPTNQWVVSGPHLMMVVPDPKALEGLPTTPESGGPWVMWSGTPYAHVMAPAGSVH